MSQGITIFLEKASLITDSSSEATFASMVKKPRARKTDESRADPLGVSISDGHEATDTQEPTEPPKPSVGDQIGMTLNHAASILRQSLELNSGGVAFLDTAVGYTAAGSIDAYLDETTILGAQYLQTRNEQTQHEAEHKSSTLSQPVHEMSENLSRRSINSSTKKHKAPKVQAISTAEIGMCYQYLVSRTNSSSMESYTELYSMPLVVLSPHKALLTL